MKLNLINIIFLFFSFAIMQTPLFEKENLADQYYDSGFFDDAIILYEEILNEQINIVGDNNIFLEKTLLKLSELYYLINDLESSKYYLQKIINIQSKYILNSQNNYLEPLHILKQVFQKEKDYNKIHNIDSLINILGSNTDTLPNDSIIILPKVIINNKQSTDNVTSYSNNDSAIDMMNEGLLYVENELYTQAADYLLKSLNYKASSMNLNYFMDLKFGDDIQINALYNALADASKDSLLKNSYFYLGIIDYQNKNYDIAKDNFKKYSQFYPKDSKGNLAIGNIYFEGNLWLDAIFHYYKVLAIDENNLDAKLNIAKSLINIKEFSDAADILRSVINLHPNNFDIYYQLGICYYELEKYDSAVKKLSQAILLNTSSSDIYYSLGLTYNKINSYKQAQEAFLKCIKLDSYNGLAHYELGNIYKLIFEDDLAIMHYKKAKKTINTSELNLNLGILYFNNEKFQSAIEPLKEYILYNMQDWDTLEKYGHALLKTNRFPEAIDIYSRLIDEYPDNSEYYSNLADSYYNLSDYSNAIENYKKILTFEDENYTVLLKIGILLNQLNKFNEAEEYLNDAIHCGSPNKELLIQLGMSYGGQQKFLQSLGAFKEALSFSLNDPIIHYQLGIIYKELEIYNLAIEEFNQYLTKNSSDYIAYYLIGDSYYNMHIYDIALEYFNKSYDINPGHIKSLYSVGSCYLKLNDNKKAARIFKSIIKRDPNHVQSRSELVDVYIALNKSREAKKECEIIYMLDREIYNSIEYCATK